MLYSSGSEEKVVRILEAPRAFLATLAAARDEPSMLSPTTSAHTQAS